MDAIFRAGLIKAVKEASAKYADLPGYEQNVQDHVDMLEKLFEKIEPDREKKMKICGEIPDDLLKQLRGEKEIKPGRSEHDEAVKLLKKIGDDVEKLKQKICGEGYDGRYIIATQDPGLSDELLKQLRGEKVKIGPANKGMIIGGMDRHAVRKSDGKEYCFFDKIANYPSRHAVIMGPAGPGKVRNTQTFKDVLKEVGHVEDACKDGDGIKVTAEITDPVASQEIKNGTWADKLSGFLIPLPIRNTPPRSLQPHAAMSRPVGRWMKCGPIDDDVVERLKKAADRGTAIADELRKISGDDTKNKFSCFLRAIIPPSIEYLMSQLWKEEDDLEVNKKRLECELSAGLGFPDIGIVDAETDNIDELERIRYDIKRNELNIEHINNTIKRCFKGATKSYLLSSRDYLKRVIRDAEESNQFLGMMYPPDVNTQMKDKRNRKVQRTSRLIAHLKMIIGLIDEELEKCKY